LIFAQTRTHARGELDFLLILYISNHNNRDIERKNKGLYARTRKNIRCPYRCLSVPINPTVP